MTRQEYTKELKIIFDAYNRIFKDPSALRIENNGEEIDMFAKAYYSFIQLKKMV